MNLATQVSVEGDYLQAIGVPLLSGRYFTPADTADTQLVAIVNHKLAEHCWPGSDPVGKRLRERAKPQRITHPSDKSARRLATINSVGSQHSIGLW